MEKVQQHHSELQSLPEQTAGEELSQLAELIDEDIEKLVALRLQAEQEAGRHQRMVERITDSVARPTFLYSILFVVLLWTTASALHVFTIDTPPFFWLQGLVGLCALLITTTVLITQNRQQKLADQRRHLDLEIALMTDRKVSKLIEMVQQLRIDMPQVKQRHDPEADAMQERTDPDRVLSTLEQTLEEASEHL